MGNEPVYLDWNATTPVAPSVEEVMLPYFSEAFGNPSSEHQYGERAAEAVAGARRELAEAIDAAPSEIYFTGSGTESNNLAVRGVAEAAATKIRVATSEIEHPSVAEPCRYLERRGNTVARIGVDGDGCLELSELEEALEDGIDLVSVMHANNEVGSIQPIAEVARLAEAYGALVHTDAAQTMGKIEVSVEELGVDLLTIAGHKMYAPKGVGALYVREGVELEPVLRGAGHERGLRPSTENVPYIVALGRAAERAVEGLDARRERMLELRERLWGRLREADVPVCRHGAPERTLPNTLNLRFEGATGPAVLSRADDVAASTGSACHEAGAVEPSSVLTAMGVEPEQAVGAVRLSLGETTDAEEIDRAARSLVEAYREL